MQYPKSETDGYGIRCPHCGERQSRTTASRPLVNGTAIRRRRKCMKCEMRFTTHERSSTASGHDDYRDNVQHILFVEKLQRLSKHERHFVNMMMNYCLDTRGRREYLLALGEYAEKVGLTMETDDAEVFEDTGRPVAGSDTG